MKILRFTITVLSVLLLSESCKLPSFSFKAGGKSGEDIPGNTIYVGFFDTDAGATLASANASSLFTEALREIFITQSDLDLETQRNTSDWILEGSITSYRVVPISIQGDQTAAQNRLEVTVKVNFYLNEDIDHNEAFTKSAEKFKWDSSPQTFRAFSDYQAEKDLSVVEDELLEDINGQLTQIIFDQAFGGDW